MKPSARNTCLLVLLAVGIVGCVSENVPPPKTVIVEPQRPPNAPADVQYNYEQKAETSKVLVSDERARKFVSDFSQLFSPKGELAPVFSIRVNLPAGGTGSQLADQQTIADYVRYFGRPLREGQIKLVDEDTARRSKPDFSPDIVLNVYASVKAINITGFNVETQTKFVPDVQVSAIRQKDGTIIGQASITDLIGDRDDAWVAVQRVGVPQVLRATALILLEDMVQRKLEKTREKLVAIINNTPAPETASAVPPKPTSPAREIPASALGLVDDLKSTDAAKSDLKTAVNDFNRQVKLVNAWEVGLFDDQAAPKTPTLARNILRSRLGIN
jgi:hypothetical protein